MVKERSEALRQQLRYNRFIAPFTTPSAKELVYSLRLLPGMNVLDHGAGTGLVSQLALHKQTNLTITALDPSAALMDAIPADDRVTQFQGTTADYCTTQAGAGVSSSKFDAILSNYVLQFCGDAADELARLRSVAEPGAALRVAVLGAAKVVEPFNRFWSAVAACVSGGWPPERYVHFQLGNPTVLAEAATKAGWYDVVVKAEWAQRSISAQGAWRWLSSTLPTGVDDAYRPLTKPERASVRETLIAKWPASGVVRTQYLRQEATAP